MIDRSHDAQELGVPLSYRLRGLLGAAERRFPLSPGRMVVGTGVDCDLVLEDGGVSRQHAALWVTAEEIRLEDLASKNGTFVNGGRVAAARLFPGDRLWLGPVELVLEAVATDDLELAIAVRGGSVAPRARGTPATTREAGLPAAPPADDPLPLPPGIVASSVPAMVEIYRALRHLAGSHVPVLLSGETGVGKEHLAQALHQASNRRSGPLIAVNCAAIPKELLEAELFGVGKGVATGVESRRGCFQRADGGTFFLDEVGELPLGLQAKLLRVLQEREVHPLGRSPEPVDVRVISATNADLPGSIEARTFRRDLYYRLAGFACRVPPLRERPEDVPPLAERFLHRFSEEAGRPVAGITIRALRLLTRYPWPGNVRELENELRRLVYLCPAEGAIESSMLSEGIRIGSETAPSPSAPSPSAPSPSASGPSAVEAPAESLPDWEAVVRRLDDLRLDRLEKCCVREALRRSGGNKAEAARRLGLSRSALGRRLERYRA